VAIGAMSLMLIIHCHLGIQCPSGICVFVYPSGLWIWCSQFGCLLLSIGICSPLLSLHSFQLLLSELTQPSVVECFIHIHWTTQLETAYL